MMVYLFMGVVVDPVLLFLCPPVLVQGVSRRPQTAAPQCSATVRTSGPPASPSSPSASTTSSPPDPRRPSPSCPCSRATSPGCRPAPGPAPGPAPAPETRGWRTMAMQWKLCSGTTRGPWLPLPLRPGRSAPRPSAATPRCGSRPRPVLGPAPPAPRTAPPARSRQSREGLRPLRLRPWGRREGRSHRCCQRCRATVSTATR